MKTLFLAWQDPSSQTWFPIGQLTRREALYEFAYLQGALTASRQGGFIPPWTFPNLHRVYRSADLFPPFANRLLRSSRPDFPDFLKWLNIPANEDDPLTLLARSGGQRRDDHFEIFPQPERNEHGEYRLHFFTHGLQSFPADVHARVQTLQPETQLLITHDTQNPLDPRALILRTQDLHLVGYCPRYVAEEFFDLVCQYPEQIAITVEKVNRPPTPIQFRLLCVLTASGFEHFLPFSGSDYQPIVTKQLPVS